MTQDKGTGLDEAAVRPAAPESAAVEPPRAPPQKARLSARFQPALNAALWQNHVPALSELAVTNVGDGALGDLEIELGSQPPVLRARTWRVAGLPPGQTRTFDDLESPSTVRTWPGCRRRPAPR